MGLEDLKRKLGHPNPVQPGALGLPQLTAEQLAYPSTFIMEESALNFRLLTIPRPCRLYVPGEHRRLRAIPNVMKHTGAQHLARKLYVPSVNGVLELNAAGDWYVNGEIVTAEGTEFEAVYHDAAFAIPDAETEDGWAQKFDPRTMLAPPAVANVTAASGLKLAARVGRRFLYAVAYNFAGGCTRVTLTFTTPAVSLRGIHFAANDWKTFDALDGITEQAVYAITDVGTADLYFVEGV